MRNLLIGTFAGAILGALCFGSIAAVTPGTWSVLEAAVIGLWAGAVCGAFAGSMSNV